MRKYYDKGLQKLLPGATNGRKALFNGAFAAWTGEVNDRLREGIATCGKNYDLTSSSRDLLAFCRKHGEHYQTDVSRGWGRRNTLVLTHPLFLSLSDAHLVKKNGHTRDAAIYHNRLMKFLESNRQQQRANVVLLETPHHYAAATSLLLEDGLAHDVRFTLFDEGTPLDAEALEEFEEDRLFFGGGYDGQCLDESLRSATEIVPLNKVWAIKDLVTRHPFCVAGELFPEKVHGLPMNRSLTLQEATKKLGFSRKKAHS